MRMPLILCSCALLAGGSAAQVRPGHAVVATKQAGMPATMLLGVDLASGATAPLGRFPSERFPPLAVAVDDLDRELLLAVDAGGKSRLLRLNLSGGVIAGERMLGDVSGSVTQIVVEIGGDYVLGVDGPAGGLIRVPRWGGSPASVRTAAWTTAISDSAVPAAWLALAQSGADGPPVRDAQVGVLTLPGGGFTIGPTVLAGYRPRAITGLVDLPTGLVRHALAHDDGTVSLFELGIGTRPLGVQLRLPPGATAAMKDGVQAFEPLVLGGAPHPYLKTFVVFGGMPQWRIVAGPFPGDPVDFDRWPPAGARIEPFARSCGSGVPLQASTRNGWPRLGNRGFTLTLAQAAPLQPAALVLGASDQRFGSLPLPVLLPGGCPLFVAPDLTFTTVADAQGNAAQPLPVPSDPGFLGLPVFGEWIQLVSGRFVTSAGLALEVGR